VQALAAVKHARQAAGRVHEWDARLETSCIAMLAYLWRRARGEKWAGSHGSARYGCSLAQLVVGVAEIMGWQDIPRCPPRATVRQRRAWERQRAAFVRAWARSTGAARPW
jgi:hypothetical protein